MKPLAADLTRSRYRQIIRLLEDTPKTPKQIAKEVGCAVSTVEAVNNLKIGVCLDCGGLVQFPCAGCMAHAGIARDRELRKPCDAHGG